MSRGAARRTAARTVLLLLLGAVLLPGCTGLSDSGPVRAGEAPAATGSAAPFDYNPPGPQPGEGRAQVVAGFLRALQATPVSTRVAAQFLTTDAADRWHPGRGTLVYGAQRVRRVPSGAVAHLRSVFLLDHDGRWLSGSPAAGEEARHDIRFRLARQHGQWRIADPPDAMIVPQSHFATRYRQYALYFFDPTGTVLVPEPVYLPDDVQAPTMLLEGLLDGPAVPGDGIELSEIPPGTRLTAPVPVRPDGVAEVPVTAELAELGPDRLERALAQLAWTLGQVQDVDRFRVMVAGRPLEVPQNGTAVDVNGFAEYSPAVASASADLFGLRDDHVVQLVGGSETDAASWRATPIRGARWLGVSMTGQRFGVVTGDGRAVFLLNRSGTSDTKASEVYAGSDVLRPMWDWTDRMWLVDRTPYGARVAVVTRGAVRLLPAPALDLQQVMAAALSRDGTRLAVAVARPAGSRMSDLLILRVVRRPNGVPVRLTRAPPIRMSTPLQRVRDVGWRDPTTVAVLTRPSRRTSQVVLTACDGSSAAVPAPTVDILFDDGVSLAASPGSPAALMVATGTGSLVALNAQGRWDFDVTPVGLRAPTFVG